MVWHTPLSPGRGSARRRQPTRNDRENLPPRSFNGPIRILNTGQRTRMHDADHRRTVPQRHRRARRRDGADHLSHRLFRRAEEHHGLQRRAVRRARAGWWRRASRCPDICARIPVALQAVLRHFGDDIAEGDILINNDPYDGGMHLPDIFIFKPLFAGAAGRSPMPQRSATTPMSADACPAPTPPTARRSTPRACASRR